MDELGISAITMIEYHSDDCKMHLIIPVWKKRVAGRKSLSAIILPANDVSKMGIMILTEIMGFA